MIKPPLATLCVLAGIVTTLPSAHAGSATGGYYANANVESVADREVARRQARIDQAKDLIKQGKKAMAEKDYEAAVPFFKTAVDNLPESPLTHDLRADALDLFGKSSVKLAEQRITEGRYKDAENLCQMVLQDNYLPTYGPALTLMRRLEDPDYFNKTVTPGFVAKVEEVKKLMVDADGYEKSGRFDAAYDAYEKVLNLDRYNVAARKGQERVNQRKDEYAKQGYNTTRSYLLWQLDKSWDMPVKKFSLPSGGDARETVVAVRPTQQLENKLSAIIIPRVDFNEATIREAISYLQQKSIQLDTATPKTGVNIVLKLDSGAGGSGPAAAATGASSDATAIPGLDAAPVAPAAGASTVAAGNPSEARITLALSNVPLRVALDYVAQQAGLKVKVEQYAVAIVPVTAITDEVFTKEYKVPPSFLSTSSSGSTAPAPAATGFGVATTGDTTTGNQIAAKKGAREVLEGSGVVFGPGATAQYLPSSSRLIVRNTQAQLELIDTIVDSLVTDTPRQVEIESKFVEIQQNNLKELSFDWLLGQFNIPGSTSVFGAGGTSGFTRALNSADFPLPFGTTGSRAVSGVTNGNRSGNSAISSNAIDSLLNPQNGVSTKSPAIFSIGGIFTDPQFQVAIRALNQAKGIDLLSAPRVTTKSGQRAVIEIIREFRYPTEFQPPQIPQNFSGSSGGTTVVSATGTTGGGGSSGGVFPVTPTTPTSFETRNTGVTLEVEPTVGPDGYTIDLNLVPQVVEFEGFINYGSPINTVSTSSILTGGGSQTVTLTDNVINQPIFSTRKVTTSVTVWDGQTVVLGGLMREDVQKVNDKVPMLGDIPLVGRLFRSQVEQHIKRNLIIFVTARLLNPAGEPILNNDEKDDTPEPLPLPQDLAAPALPEAPLYSK